MQYIVLILLDNTELPDKTYNNLLFILINKAAEPGRPNIVGGLVSYHELKGISGYIDSSLAALQKIADNKR